MWASSAPLDYQSHRGCCRGHRAWSWAPSRCDHSRLPLTCCGIVLRVPHLCREGQRGTGLTGRALRLGPDTDRSPPVANRAGGCAARAFSACVRVGTARQASRRDRVGRSMLERLRGMTGPTRRRLTFYPVSCHGGPVRFSPPDPEDQRHRGSTFRLLDGACAGLARFADRRGSGASPSRPTFERRMPSMRIEHMPQTCQRCTLPLLLSDRITSSLNRP